jgi:MarR family transcriptional regulator, transcriptional regulator for hemolysin
MNDTNTNTNTRAIKAHQAREQFTLALVRLSRRWRWCLNRRLAKTGLTQARWGALLQIARGGEGMAQHRLAEHIGIEGATLVPLLDSLTRAGLVERQPDPRDRRSKTVHLTAEAAPVLAEIEAIADGLRAELTEGLSQDDIATCMRVFKHIAARIPHAALHP